MPLLRKVRFLHIGLPGWIFVGATLGVLTGIFIGERAAVFKPVGTAYVMLLEAVVYPYVICSLLHGLGRLEPGMAIRLFKRSWPFYLLAWGLTLSSAYLFSLALPSAPAPYFIDGVQAGQSAPSLLELILPSNIFLDLTRNNVPAVVVLSILFGVALQKSTNKEGLMNILDLIRKAGVRIWGWVVYLAPFAVFAMFAETAGTIRPAALENMLLYLGLFLAGTFLLAFWALPGLIAALAPVSYREVLHDLRGAFILSMMTTLSVVALPFIQEAASKLARASGVEEESSSEIIGASLAVNYPLGQLGNFFVYFFMLFAAETFGASLGVFQSAALPFMTLLSCVGSPTSTVNAVDFLGSWLGFHGDALPLYIETMVVTRYGQVALSVAGFAFLTILMTQSYFGELRVRVWPLFRHSALFLAALGGLTLGGAMLSKGAPPAPSGDYATFELTPQTTKDVKAKVCQSQADCPPSPAPKAGAKETVFGRIRRSGTLRVGYNPGFTPFCYKNAKGDLVGYDVACAYDMAKSLNVSLVFVPFDLDSFQEDLRDGAFDIAMAGLYITPERLRWAEVSPPYYQSPVALITPSKQAGNFLDMNAIREMQNLKVASFKDPVLEPFLRRVFPFADQEVVPDYESLATRPDIDAAVWTSCQAKSFASAHKGFTAVRPRNLNEVMVFGYYLPPDSDQMQRFVKHWIDLRRRDGSLKRLADYWIEGKPPVDLAPRWSVMRNVLGWTD